MFTQKYIVCLIQTEVLRFRADPRSLVNQEKRPVFPCFLCKREKNGQRNDLVNDIQIELSIYL